jgi:serine/threonine-protein kinase
LSSADSTKPPATGDIIAGKYQVERMLGEGGMGVVVLARHLGLDEMVAIKVLRPEATSDAEAVARLVREARATVRIKNEHVARVLDVGEMENGSPFIVMEHLEGDNLDKLLATHRQFPVEVAVDYVAQACEALAAAHALGIVHRDVKPSNLFLTKRSDGSECLKVLDFGISKSTSPMDATQPEANITRTHSVIGTPQYMAPEQMRSQRNVDSRTDVWGLGTLLYELLAGTPPFTASTMPELCAMILRDPAPPLGSHRPDVPEQLAAIVRQCLDKNPDERFANAAELAFAIAPYGTELSRVTSERIKRAAALVPPRITPRALPRPSSSAMMEAAITANDKPKARAILPYAFGTFLAAMFLGGMGMTAYVLHARARVEAPPSASPTIASAQTPETPILDPLPPPTFTLPETVPAESASAAPSASGARHPTRPRPRASASAAQPPPPSNPPGLASSRYD